jgi:four helix bundle protein
MSQELESRFEKFAISTRDFCRKLKWDIINVQYIKQVIRSSSSIGANYIEASDDLGKQDQKMKIKIGRREAKESIYWLKLILVYNDEVLEKERNLLIDEASQLKKILSAILLKLGL